MLSKKLYLICYAAIGAQGVSSLCVECPMQRRGVTMNGGWKVKPVFRTLNFVRLVQSFAPVEFLQRMAKL
jgi:hypothetical protein